MYLDLKHNSPAQCRNVWKKNPVLGKSAIFCTFSHFTENLIIDLVFEWCLNQRYDGTWHFSENRMFRKNPVLQILRKKYQNWSYSAIFETAISAERVVEIEIWFDFLKVEGLNDVPRSNGFLIFSFLHLENGLRNSAKNVVKNTFFGIFIELLDLLTSNLAWRFLTVSRTWSHI